MHNEQLRIKNKKNIFKFQFCFYIENDTLVYFLHQGTLTIIKTFSIDEAMEN